MDENQENTRLLWNLALSAGKIRKSAQTGYLHHCYQFQEGQPSQTIPLVENFLFALALLRSRTVENIQEAKTLLDGLLYFQNKLEGDPAKGNFPIYIHEFPFCKNYLTGTHAACAIYWILKHFQQVIGQDLKKRLLEGLSLCVEHALKTCIEKKLSYPLKVKIAAVALSCGKLLDNALFSNEGERMLQSLQQTPDGMSLHCPSSLGSMAASLLMVFPKLSESPWQFLWDHLQKTWHQKTASYAALALQEWQCRNEPQVTIYDLLCGCFSKNFSERALKDSITQLEAGLIPPLEEHFLPLCQPVEWQGDFQGRNWLCRFDINAACSYIEKKEVEINPVIERGMYFFKLLWGNQQRTHTFVCQGGNAKTISFKQGEMIFELDGEALIEDKEKSREIFFFIDAHEGLEFFVSGKKSSTFSLGEELIIKDKNLTLSLSFHLESGEGRFMGHWMPGNRPAQIEAKGEARFEAYDWQLFLRTIQRSEKCRLKVKYSIDYR